MQLSMWGGGCEVGVLIYLMVCGVEGLRKGRVGQMVHLSGYWTTDEA